MGASSYWKRLTRHFTFIVDNIKWLVREAAISFWYDNWLGSGSLYSQGWHVVSSQLKLKDTLEHVHFNIRLLHSLDGASLIKEFLSFPIAIKPGYDTLIWCLTTDGYFTTRSAWSLMRVKGRSLLPSQLIWNPVLQLKFRYLF